MPGAASARCHGSSMKPRIFHQEISPNRHLQRHRTQKMLHIALLGAVQQLHAYMCAAGCEAHDAHV